MEFLDLYLLRSECKQTDRGCESLGESLQHKSEADQANRERVSEKQRFQDHEKGQQNKRIVFQVKSRSLSESREVKKVDSIQDEV